MQAEKLSPAGGNVLPFYDKATWLEQRRKGIGSSDIAAILGACSPNMGTPYSVYCDKRGEFHEELDNLEYVQAGNFLEDGIARWFAFRTGRTVMRPAEFAGLDGAEQVIWQDPKLPILQSTPDFVQSIPPDADDECPFERQGPGVLECKNVGLHLRSQWVPKEGKMPLRVMVQVQHQLAGTGLQWGTGVGLIGGNQLVWVDVPRNQRFIDAMRRRADAFWRAVEKGNPPDLDGADKTWEAIKAQYEKETGEAKAVPPELIAEFNEGARKEREGKAMKGAARNAICSHLGDATFGEVAGAHACQWKEQNQAVMKSVGTRRARVFRILKAGQEL